MAIRIGFDDQVFISPVKFLEIKEEQETILEWIVEHQDEIKGFRSGICLFFYQVQEDTANRGMDMVSVDREIPLSLCR